MRVSRAGGGARPPADALRRRAPRQRSDRLHPDDAEELGAGLEVVVELAEHGARRGVAVLLLDAAHLHAHVAPFHDHGHAGRIEDLADRLRHLVRQPLLHLQPAGEHVDDARDLAQPHHLAARDVAHVGAAEEGQQVVLAEAEELDVLHHHHLAAVLVEDGAVEQRLEVLAVALAEVGPGLGHAQRRAQQAFALRILADLGQQRPGQLFDAGQVVGGHGVPRLGERMRQQSKERGGVRSGSGPDLTRT